MRITNKLMTRIEIFAHVLTLLLLPVVMTKSKWVGVLNIFLYIYASYGMGALFSMSNRDIEFRVRRMRQSVSRQLDNMPSISKEDIG